MAKPNRKPEPAYQDFSTHGAAGESVSPVNILPGPIMEVPSHAATASQVADFLEDPKNGFRRLDVREIVKTLRIRARG